MTDIPISNKFIPRNDWHLRSFRCKKYEVNFNIVDTYYKLSCIINEVLQKTNIHKKLFVSKTRFRPAVEARQMYFKRARLLTNATFKEIGSMVESGDHSNVQYGVNQVNTVPSLIKRYNELFNN